MGFFRKTLQFLEPKPGVDYKVIGNIKEELLLPAGSISGFSSCNYQYTLGVGFQITKTTVLPGASGSTDLQDWMT